MKEFWFYDTTACIWLPEVTPEAERDFRAILAEMERLRFAVYPCEHTAKHYPLLLPDRKRAHHGRLKARIQLNGRYIEVLFYQDEVRKHTRSGEYDFDKLAKMPYLIRLRYQWARERLAKFLGSIGYHARPEDAPDWHNPWNYFKDNCRKRDASGWPTEDELRCWRRTDGDGIKVNNGDTRLIRINGRWMRCKVYGGINGMWLCVSCDQLLWQASVSELRSVLPGRGRLFDERDREKRRQAALEKAVRDQDFLRAHAIKMAMRGNKGKELVPA